MLTRTVRGKRSAGSFWQLAGQPQPDTIVVAGVGRGDEIEWLKHFMPGVRLIGVEPLDVHYQDLRQDFPGTLVRGALWSDSRQIQLHCNYEPDQRASAYPLLEPLEDEVTLPAKTLTLAELHAKYGPWGATLLWLDAEGSELEILRGATEEVMQSVYWINIEMGLLSLRQSPGWRAVDRYLQILGFEPSGMHATAFNGTHCDWVYMRRELLEELKFDTLDLAIRRKKEMKEEREREEVANL